MEKYLRDWRETALQKNAYDTAAFVGDKLVALTNDPSDTLALARIHYTAGNYSRALNLLLKSSNFASTASASGNSLSPQRVLPPDARYLAAQCYIQQNQHEEALAFLGEKNPVHLVTTPNSARRKLLHLSRRQDRPLNPTNTNNASTNTSNGKLFSTKAQSKSTRSERVDRSEEREQEQVGNLKYEAGMCYLRGLCFAKNNAFDRAKACYKDAVRIDVQCFEAFEQLMKNSLMSPGEEWDFLESLDFDSIATTTSDTSDEADTTMAEAADFTRNIYTTLLSKYARPESFATALETLSTHYNLTTNPAILHAKAEILFTASRHKAALALTTEILSSDPGNLPTIPLHLACLYELNHTRALFALAHELADSAPNEPSTWLAVGTYYLSTHRIPEARSYFSKASLMDPHFGPAWIGFAHTFAAEGEADQAIAAYSTAARLFQGTHLPLLFLGMQELGLGNLGVAREFFTSAYSVCERDPLLVNEMGVCCYREGEFESAVRHFLLALRFAEENESPAHTPANVTTRLNLAHALRQCNRFHEALEQFEEVIRLSPSPSSSTSSTNNSSATSAAGPSATNAGLADVFSSKALVLLELDEVFEATVALHAALAISPLDAVASELLSRALALLEIGDDEAAGGGDEEFEVGLKERLRAGQGRRRRRRERGGGSGDGGGLAMDMDRSDDLA